MIDKNAYSVAFNLIISDFKKITYYIEPSDNHKIVYSHRIYELFLRSCTEFESVCRDLLTKEGYNKKTIDKTNICDYKELNKYYNYSELEIGLLYWQPKPLYIIPFDGWDKNSPPLKWYDSYNDVKHNRNSKFQKANFENLTLSIAGLFALLAINHLFIMIDNFDSNIDLSKGRNESFYYDFLHSTLPK